MKHAYLIIAHNEFDILRLLVESLDDARNDLFVHIDKKVEDVPSLHTRFSRLYVLEDRVDVRWGNVSQIECELRLFEAAYQQGPYDFYHLISGTHLPLKSNDYIDAFFSGFVGNEIMHMWPFDDYEADIKIRFRHLYTSVYKSPIKSLRLFSQFMWNINVKIQKLLGIRRYKNQLFYKSDNWVSLSQNAISFLVHRKKEILRKYRFTFCGDEFFVASELKACGDRFQIMDRSGLLFVDFINGAPRDLNASDLEALKKSECLFARKFNSSDSAFLHAVINHAKYDF